MLKSEHEPIHVREKLLTARFVTDAYVDTDTYTDHGHGSQFTDLWMASFSLIINIEIYIFMKPTSIIKIALFIHGKEF